MQNTDAGQRHREREAERSRKQSRAVRDIAPLPPIVNPKCRQAARKSLRYFLEHYLSAKFSLAWASYHLEVIQRLEHTVKKGGLFSLAMPRGSGKTTLTVGAAIWALLYGFRRYVVMVGSNKEEAVKLLESVKNALQHAMNKWCDHYEAFMSECQNEPIQAGDGAVVVPAKTTRKQLNGLERYEIPADATTLTAFADVHDDLLYYCTVAWNADSFTGYIVDYGTYPEQRRPIFSKGEKSLITLQKITKAATPNAATQIGLTTLLKDLLAKDWDVQGDRDGAEHRMFDLILVDSGYVPAVVENAIRLVRSPVIKPSKGTSVKATNKEMAGWKKKPGRRFGRHWIEDKPQERTMRTVTFDANQWKTNVHAAFAAGAGSRGSLTLWGTDPETHRMFSEHLNSETSKLVEYNGNKVREWEKVPNRDNHYFDCLVGCMVGASVCGVKTADMETAPQGKRVTLSELKSRGRSLHAGR